ncbi:thioredoxin domain-containing protein [Paraliomyxa miuraensis]|uniref:hypothetical protein n=1 Tax=Paraliomyxa miuraensis TaxID=376150 RepID=UPI00224CBE5F|nr:hypothetical protein [Paraliomyxa miuraensis]MCX4242215.1 hypothetical protein [Paraliomyxa miuraensis]
MTTPRSIAFLAAAVLASGLACASAPPAAVGPVTGSAVGPATSPTADAPEGSGPPMYKPSSTSPAPVSIVDPAYGAFLGAPDAPGMGQTLPDFEVPLADGGTFSLEQARKAGPVLVMFYRGFW